VSYGQRKYTYTYYLIVYTDLIYEPGSSVSIVPDYGLEGRGSIPDRDRGFFL
jgi:hypothetical protein